MNEKFQIGLIQKKWIESLKAHPERQEDGVLGIGEPKNYKACCLGEYLLTYCRHKKIKMPFEDNTLYDLNMTSSCTLVQSFNVLGLRNDIGELRNLSKIGNTHYSSLAGANDDGVTWPEIAEFIENNPELVFTKSV